MVQSLRYIKSRIRSIENVKKVTHAMEMISVAKLRSSENSLTGMRDYFLKTESVVRHILAYSQAQDHSLVRRSNGSGKTALLVITSDTGLCSRYNFEIIRLAEEHIRKIGRQNVSLVLLGRKGVVHFKKQGIEVIQSYPDLHGRFSPELSTRVLNDLTGIFLSGKADFVDIAYTRFVSASRHSPQVERFLNIPSADIEPIDYILEPGLDRILNELIPVYISLKIKMILLDSFASEHAARMQAMGEATNNAKELLEGLVLSRNKLRQANITKEILEIVSSAEVLN